MYNDVVIKGFSNSIGNLIQHPSILNEGDLRPEYVELVGNMSQNDRDILQRMVVDIMEDTISHVFGILDGSTTLGSGDLDVVSEIRINSTVFDDGLQDLFWEYVQENIER